MSASPENVLQKLHQVVDTLATHPGYIRERLIDAGLILVQLLNSDLPPKYQQEFASIREALTNVDPRGNEGRLAATVNSMSSEDAAQIANRIVQLMFSLQNEITYPDD
jgi:rhamnogalacturonyl hydrolase YesR